MLMEKKVTAKKKLTTFIFAASVCFGLFLIIAPLVLGYINQKRADEAIASYNNTASQSTDAFAEEFAQAEKYNLAIAGSIRDEGQKERYGEILDIEKGIMGYIEIPRIGIRNPIYHGIEEEVLQKGIGHLPSTSFPIGGVGNHAALSGHRGLPSSKLFTDLDRVRKDDIIVIRIVDRVLAYKVYDIEIVEPDYADGLKIDPHRDLLTLITCTPYAVNTHRLLVHAERTEYKDEMSNIKTERTISESDRILLIALGVVALILGVDIVVILKRRRRERSSA